MEDFYHRTEFLEKSPNLYSTKENSHLTYLKMKLEPPKLDRSYIDHRLDPATCAKTRALKMLMPLQRGLGWIPTGEENELRATHSSERRKKGNRSFSSGRRGNKLVNSYSVQMTLYFTEGAVLKS